MTEIRNNLGAFIQSLQQTRAQASQRQTNAAGGEQLQPRPRQAPENFIPSPQSLDTMTRVAISASKEGNVPDRGSILNLVV